MISMETTMDSIIFIAMTVLMLIGLRQYDEYDSVLWQIIYNVMFVIGLYGVIEYFV